MGMYASQIARWREIEIERSCAPRDEEHIRTCSTDCGYRDYQWRQGEDSEGGLDHGG